jgi:hypothetical protein
MFYGLTLWGIGWSFYRHGRRFREGPATSKTAWPIAPQSDLESENRSVDYFGKCNSCHEFCHGSLSGFVLKS